VAEAELLTMSAVTDPEAGVGDVAELPHPTDATTDNMPIACPTVNRSARREPFFLVISTLRPHAEQGVGQIHTRSQADTYGRAAWFDGTINSRPCGSIWLG
jgi:hypothetical protein